VASAPNINASCCSQFLTSYFVTWLWTRRRFKSVRTWTHSENTQRLWRTTAVDRRTSLSMRTAAQPRTPRIILGGRSILMFRHWSIRLHLPTGETLQVTIRHWLTLSYHCFLLIFVLLLSLLFLFLLFLFFWSRVGVVIGLQRSADCLYMVQLMPLHHQIPSSRASFKSRLFTFVYNEY